ncbi:MAG: carbohydrate-binding protein [Oscillospiraceae bacterium]|nr:carbohydrate-binding protein [Oscillospiraceae bacterium]
MAKTKRALSIALAMAFFMSSVPAFNITASAQENIQTAFYVSPDGDDMGSGTKSSPFGTLERARDAVREVNKDMSGDIYVYLRGGTYRITQPVEFDTRDSGTNGYNICYTAYESETPVINGATQVTGWTAYNDHIYKAKLDRNYKLRNLYVNDSRAHMDSITVNAKGGYGEYSITAGQASWAWDSGKKSDGISYNPSDIPQIKSNKDDLEIINGTTWNENIVCTRDIISAGGSTVMLLQQPYGSIAQTPGWGAGFSCSGTHTIYNAFEFLDSPGEFYFDKTQKTLYYYPRQGENMETADVEAPVTDKLIVVAGESTGNRVKNIGFNGITFENTDYQLTKVGDSYGKTTCQGANSYTAFADSNWHSKNYEMVDTLPAIIHVTSCDSIKLTGNTVKHSGADGMSFTNDVVNSEVSGNYITDITSSGITVGHPQNIYIGDSNGSNREKYPKGVEGVCKNDIITNNMLYDISVVHGFGGCAAITAYYADSVKITYNQIKKTAYNGIHLGWGWCNFLDSTTCRDNVISYNRVIDSLNRLHDSGGIYTIGQMPGTVINENYIQNIPAAAPYQPTYGLHNDEGTAYIEENDNVLEISPDVTYTINCEDYGKKHDLTILRTYATVCRMGIDPPSSKIDKPVVVADNVWPFEQYRICLNSGIQEEYRDIIPDGLFSQSDIVFPASCQAKGGIKLPVRSAGKNYTIWFAPDNTTSFKLGSSMTRSSSGSLSIMTPEDEGIYKLYVVDENGRIISKSDKILRVSGSASQIDASSYSDMSGIQTENCSEGGLDVAYIDNGDYIGFKNIDFAPGADSIDMRLASGSSGGDIEIRLGGPDGQLIGSASVGNTDGWQTYITKTCDIKNTTGIQDVYFVFKGGEGSLLNMRWWKPNIIQNTKLAGDVDANGSVNASDFIALRQFLLGTDDKENYGYDVNNDEAVNIVDLIILINILIES